MRRRPLSPEPSGSSRRTPRRGTNSGRPARPRCLRPRDRPEGTAPVPGSRRKEPDNRPRQAERRPQFAAPSSACRLLHGCGHVPLPMPRGLHYHEHGPPRAHANAHVNVHDHANAVALAHEHGCEPEHRQQPQNHGHERDGENAAPLRPSGLLHSGESAPPRTIFSPAPSHAAPGKRPSSAPAPLPESGCPSPRSMSSLRN
ncbi:hypothetical protein D3C71_1518960 [compost metagenome]